MQHNENVHIAWVGWIQFKRVNLIPISILPTILFDFDINTVTSLSKMESQMIRLIKYIILLNCWQLLTGHYEANPVF